MTKKRDEDDNNDVMLVIVQRNVTMMMTSVKLVKQRFKGLIKLTMLNVN